jgi:hypothetical protein
MGIRASKNKAKDTVDRPKPVVFVPNNSYVSDAGQLIPTDVIVVTGEALYERAASVIDILDQNVTEEADV